MNPEAEIPRINAFVEKGNYHAALNIALSCMNDGYRSDNQVQVDQFLGIIRTIYDSLADKFGSDEFLNKK